MKKIVFLLFLAGIFTACEDHFLKLDPLDEITEAAYFKTPTHFKTATVDFYNKMLGWRHQDEVTYDWGTDLNGYIQDYGQGIVIAPDQDDWWDDSYENLRNVNILLQKADKYEGDQAEIAEYVAVAKFFRAYHHFTLLQRYGGVPIVTEVLDIDSEELTASRSSRYEVFYQIYTDLKAAIPNLRTEQDIPTGEKGTVSKWAAEAFLAKNLLFEATWEMNVGVTTDGDGTTAGAGSTKPSGYPSTSAMIAEANALAKDVMDNGGYELWNKNDDPLMKNWSNCYLFNLEDAGSNPGGYEKSSNNEFILYTKFDYNLYRGNTNISHAIPGRASGTRKFIDMFLCSDGLPVDKSPLFMGYEQTSSEYQNRDLRLTSYFAHWDTWDTPYDGQMVLLSSTVQAATGYPCRKFRSYNYGSYRAVNEESFDFPQIRLPEVYLIYAETLYHMNGSISDAQLNESINKIKARAGLPPLTNAFATANGLDMWEEIMRERTIELYIENSSRFNDLKRFGIAEVVLGEALLGSVIEGTDYENNPALYTPENWPFGETKAQTGVGERNVLVIDLAANRNFQRKHYLWPLPLEQINLNGNLLQNPGY